MIKKIIYIGVIVFFVGVVALGVFLMPK